MSEPDTPTEEDVLREKLRYGGQQCSLTWTIKVDPIALIVRLETYRHVSAARKFLNDSHDKGIGPFSKLAPELLDLILERLDDVIYLDMRRKWKKIERCTRELCSQGDHYDPEMLKALPADEYFEKGMDRWIRRCRLHDGHVDDECESCVRHMEKINLLWGTISGFFSIPGLPNEDLELSRAVSAAISFHLSTLPPQLVFLPPATTQGDHAILRWKKFILLT